MYGTYPSIPRLVQLTYLAIQVFYFPHLSVAGGTECGDIMNISIKHGVGKQDGDLVQFQCKQGYILRGETVVTCEKGRLIGRLPQCVKDSKDTLQSMKITKHRNKEYYQRNKQHIARTKKGISRGKLQVKNDNMNEAITTNVMMNDQPPGLGIPYGNDVVGHQDHLIIPDIIENGYENGEQYDEDYDEEEYNEEEYEEMYENVNEYDGNDDYYDYEYEEDFDEDYESDKDYDYGSDKDYEEYEYDREYSSSNDNSDVSDSNVEANTTISNTNASKVIIKENDYANEPTTSTNYSKNPVTEGSGLQEDNLLITDDEDLKEASGDFQHSDKLTSGHK